MGVKIDFHDLVVAISGVGSPQFGPQPDSQLILAYLLRTEVIEAEGNSNLAQGQFLVYLLMKYG